MLSTRLNYLGLLPAPDGAEFTPEDRQQMLGVFRSPIILVTVIEASPEHYYNFELNGKSRGIALYPKTYTILLSKTYTLG